MRIKVFPFLLVCVTASLSFNTVVAAQSSSLDFGTATIDDLRIIQNSPITPVTLPVVPSDSNTITYSITPTLPDGLTFTASNRILTGTPHATSPTTEYTYTASDTAGHTDSLTFTITVEEDTVPVAQPRGMVHRFSVARWRPVLHQLTHTLASFTGGNGPLTYLFNRPPSLPEWIIFDPATRQLKVSPVTGVDQKIPLMEVSYTATDADGDTALHWFYIIVDDPRPNFGGMKIPNVVAMWYSQIKPITLPRATNGVYYTLTPSLPAGLDFRAPERYINRLGIPDRYHARFHGSLSGTPRVVTPATTYTYTADNDRGDTTSLTFTIAVEKGPDTVPVAPTESQVFSFRLDGNGRQRVDHYLSRFTGGNGRLIYRLSSTPKLPESVSLHFENSPLHNRSRPWLRGWIYDTADDQTSETTYTYTATDADGDVNSATFTIEIADTIGVVDDLILVAPPKVSNFIFTLGEEISVTLPEFTGGNGVLTYSLTGLPSGLSFDPNVRMLSGALFVVMPPTTITYTATDDYATPDVFDDDEVSVTFTITVVEGQVPQEDVIPVAPSTPQHFVFVPGQAVSVTLEPFTGGDGELTYALSPLSPYLPDELVFDDSTLTISGTLPPDTAGDDSIDATTYTYTATDRDGDEVAAAFTIEVIDSRPLAPVTFPDLTFTLDQHNHVVLPAFTTSADHLLNVVSPELTYTITAEDGGPLPSWLLFGVENRTISGTPNTAGVFAVTYTASDGVDSDSVAFTISVIDEPIPMPPIIPSGGYVFEPGQSVQLILPPFTVSDGSTLTHSLDDADDRVPITTLIGGLTYDPQTRTISGTVPGTAGDDSDSAAYIYSATDTDEDGLHDTTHTTFTITIVDGMPDFGSEVIDNISGTVGTVITPVTLPQVSTTGTGTTTYSFTPNLPQWLSFDSERVLSGTPTGEGVISVTYAATDDDGDTDFLTFTIIIAEPQPPKVVEDTKPIAPSSPQAFVFELGQAVSETLLPFTGGDGALSYALSSSLPAGLVFSASTRTVRGTVHGTSSDDSIDPTTYTYTATDEDGDTDSAAFTITIVDSIPVAPSVAQNFVFAAGDVIDEELAAFTGGNSTLTYALSPTPSLPSGLSFDANTTVISGTIVNTAGDDSVPATTYTYSATDEDGDEATATFTIEVVEFYFTAPTVPNYSFDQDVPLKDITLPSFTSTSGQPLSYTLTPLPNGLTFDKDKRELAGTPTQAGTTAVTYTASDENGEQASVIFNISVIEFYFTAPAIGGYKFTLNKSLDPITLPSFSSTSGQTLSYTLVPLPQGLTFNDVTRVLAGTPTQAGNTRVRYTATDPNGSYAATEIPIVVVDVVALETATTGALPSVGANVALVATEAISTRVGLALDGQSQGLDIRTPSGQQFKLGVNGANAQGSSTASAIRFGAWYSTSHDELSNTQTDLAWSGITDSTNVGIDIGFDLSSKASLVFGVMQNASTTSATYGDANGNKSGLLDVDLDATTFYVGFGYDWLDVWFANGSANSMLNDSARDGVIPTSFAYQTVGLTAAFDFTDGFQVGAKVESLNSVLSLSSQEALNYKGLESDSSQFRTAFFVNYKLDLGKQGNAQFIPKFEMGYRGLTQNSNSSAAAASAGTAAETSFGVDYLQKQLNLTIGFSIRSFEVQNYASESTQWHIRWESSTYDKGLSLQLRPTVVAESLGLDALYNSDYSQYQNLLSRQYGGDSQVDDDGLDFEMGYGITFGSGTYTPFVKTTNFVFGQAANNSRRTQEVGIRYTTPSGLDLTLAMERLYNPVSSFSSQSAFGVATSPLMQRENSLEFSTRYNF